MKDIFPAVQAAIRQFQDRGGEFTPELGEYIRIPAAKVAAALQVRGREDEDDGLIFLAESLNTQIAGASDANGVLNLVQALDTVLEQIEPYLTQDQIGELENMLDANIGRFQGALTAALEEPPDMGEFPAEPVDSPPPSTRPAESRPAESRPVESRPATESGAPVPDKLFSRGAIIGLAIAIPLFLGGLIVLAQLGKKGKTRTVDSDEDADIIVLDAQGQPLKGAARNNRLKKFLSKAK